MRITEQIRINDKYAIVININGKSEEFIFKCLRYGEDWRDLTGDNLILAMAYRIQDLEARLIESNEYIEYIKDTVGMA